MHDRERERERERERREVNANMRRQILGRQNDPLDYQYQYISYCLSQPIVLVTTLQGAVFVNCTACGSNCNSCIVRGAGKCDENKCKTGFGLTQNSICDRESPFTLLCSTRSVE